MHFFTRKSELERILVSGTYSRALQSRFSASLRSSRQLAGIKRAVFAEIEFDVPAILEAVIVNKGISRSGPLFRSTCVRPVWVHAVVWNRYVFVCAGCFRTCSCVWRPSITRTQ